jgi:LemA protein
MSEMKKNTNWKVPIITGVGILAFILMVVFGVQGSQNTAISLEEQVNAAKSGIQVQEMQRISHVQNLVDCVK